jgi:hypothetical protein
VARKVHGIVQYAKNVDEAAATADAEQDQVACPFAARAA